MTKRRHAEKNALYQSVDGPPEVLRAPTLDELEDLRSLLVIHAEQVPAELYLRLSDLIDWSILQQPWTRRHIQLTRWRRVRDSLERGNKLEAAYLDAKKACEGTPAQAGVKMMKKDFDQVEKGIVSGPPSWIRDAVAQGCHAIA